MTDKQIIIDGVDVSGCEFRFRTYGCDCMSSNRETKVLTESSRCADNPNCYYKQLKRKEQECEELKKQIKIIDDETIVVEITETQFEEYQKLKQTLTEIKEIASKVLLNTHDLEQFKDADALFVSLLKIHKKISEVEDD